MKFILKMELKEFVKNVIVEIAEGVVLAKENLEKHDVLINPTSSNGKVKESGNQDRSIQNIEFDLTVSVKNEESAIKEDSNEVGGKIQVVSLFYFGISDKQVNKKNVISENVIHNRVKFSVPISLPTNTKFSKIKMSSAVIGR